MPHSRPIRRDPCAAAARSLAVAPAVAQPISHSRARTADRSAPSVSFSRNAKICWSRRATSGCGCRRGKLIHYRVGVIGGMATGVLTLLSCGRRRSTQPAASTRLTISDGTNELPVIDRSGATGSQPARARSKPCNRQRELVIRTVTTVERTPCWTRSIMLLPLLMWVAAALLSWLLVRRLLLVPLAGLQRAVSEYQPERRGIEPARQSLASRPRSATLRWPSNARSIGSKEPSARRWTRWTASGGWSARCTTGSRTTSRSSRHCSASMAAARPARGQGGLFSDRPAGRRIVGGPPPSLCRAGGKSRDRASSAADRTGGRPPVQRSGRGARDAHRTGPGCAVDDPGCGGRRPPS